MNESWLGDEPVFLGLDPLDEDKHDDADDDGADKATNPPQRLPSHRQILSM